MEQSPPRLALRLVGASYVVVGLISAALIVERYLVYVRNPQDVAAAGGMYAGGDLLLEIIICLMFLVPTAGLVLVIRKSESAFTAYAKVLLGLSLTGPISLLALVIPVLNQWYWGDAITFRLFAIPIVFFVEIASWFLSRFAGARRLISYALLVEGATFAVTVGGLFFFIGGRG